jgi:hypothetical protein
VSATAGERSRPAFRDASHFGATSCRGFRFPIKTYEHV